jgi:hypothetical protein
MEKSFTGVPRRWDKCTVFAVVARPDVEMERIDQWDYF